MGSNQNEEVIATRMYVSNGGKSTKISVLEAAQGPSLTYPWMHFVKVEQLCNLIWHLASMIEADL